jgi:PAS domain S-box-containing protein
MTDQMPTEEPAATTGTSQSAVLESLIPFLLLLTPDGTISEAHGGRRDANGSAVRDAIGKKLWDGHWWSRSQEHKAQLREAVARAAMGETQRLDVPQQTAGTPERWLDLQITPLCDAAGRVTHLSAAGSDITARKEAEESLRRRAEELERLLEVVPAAVWVATDPECRTIKGNQRANELCGAAPGENVSATTALNGRCFLSPAGRELSADELPMQVAAATNRAVRDAQLSLMLPSGEKRTLLGNAVPLRGARNEVRGCIGAFIDVTERQRAEEALRQSQEWLQLFVEQAPAALAMFDRDMRYLAISRRWRVDYALGDGQIIGRSHYEIFPEIPDTWKAVHRRALDGEAARCNEDRFDRLDGTVQWLRWEVSPWYRADGAVGGLVMLTEDITERKRTEAALRKSEQWLSGIVSSALDAIIAVDEEQRIRLFNPAAEAMFGVSAAEVAGRPLARLIPERSRRAHEEHVRAFARTGTTARRIGALGTLRGLRANGEEFPLEASISQVQVGEERIFTVILRDITERAQAEAALRESQERLSLALEAAGAGHWEWDLDSGRAACDTECYRLWGVEHGLQGLAEWLAVVHPEDRERVERGFREAGDRGRELRLEFRVAHPQRGTRWLLIRGRTFRDENKGWARMIGLSIDITKRKQAEEALREADRRKDEFLATLAHELRNPLAPIRNAVDILKLQELSDPSLQAARDILDRQSRQLVRLVDDLLDVNRITRGKLQLRKEHVELAAVLAQALEGAGPQVLSAGQELSVSLPPEPLYLDADPLRLAQVFVNLLTNASKYTDKGGRIRLSAQQTGEEVVVKVEDTGVGIAPGHLSDIFEMFAQVRSSALQPLPGIGIGLALARDLVVMHGGRIEAHSEGVGQGSAFIVYLPVVADAATPSPSDRGATSDLRAPTSRRILVVDDEAIVARALAVLLRLLGNEVEIAHDGLEAVAAAERYRPDVIFLDIGMPRLDGYAACRQIRAQPWGQGIKIVALTGWGTDKDRGQTAEAGFDAHLVKPVDASALVQLLGEPPAAKG